MRTRESQSVGRSRQSVSASAQCSGVCMRRAYLPRSNRSSIVNYHNGLELFDHSLFVKSCGQFVEHS